MMLINMIEILARNGMAAYASAQCKGLRYLVYYFRIRSSDIHIRKLAGYGDRVKPVYIRLDEQIPSDCAAK